MRVCLPKFPFSDPDFLNKCQGPLLGAESPTWPERSEHRAMPLTKPGSPEGPQSWELLQDQNTMLSPRLQRSRAEEYGTDLLH